MDTEEEILYKDYTLQLLWNSQKLAELYIRLSLVSIHIPGNNMKPWV